MSQLTHTPLSNPPSMPRFDREDRRSVVVGLILTAIVWPTLLFLLGTASAGIGGQGKGRVATPKAKPVFNIEIEPDQFLLPQEQPKPDRFVEVNPDAPENIPDKTRNFGAQNQQVAQEVPAKENNSELPQTEGRKDMESTQIVDGRLTQPDITEAPPPPPPSPELMQAVREAQQQREQNPLAGETKDLGESETGYGFNMGKVSDNPEDVPEHREGSPTAPLIVGNPQQSVVKVDPQRPMPRPRLERRTRPAVMVERLEGTTNIGIRASNARWSQYGQYFQRLIDSVQIEWERILMTTGTRPPPGSTVEVKFKLDGKLGEISEIISVNGNAGNAGNRACSSAISSRSPYGEWPEDMKAVLGTELEMTFTFLYQ